MFIHGIAIKRVKRGPMIEIEKALVTVASGVEDDRLGGKDPRRQVTILSLQQWLEACAELGNVELPWTTRRANICVSGVSFSANDVGKSLHFGSTLILEVTGETDPCPRMDEAFKGLRAALEPSWRAGITCRVLHGGIIGIHTAGRFASLDIQ